MPSWTSASLRPWWAPTASSRSFCEKAAPPMHWSCHAARRSSCADGRLSGMVTGHDASEVGRTFSRLDGAAATQERGCELAAGEHHEHRVVHPREEDHDAADDAVRRIRRKALHVQAEEQCCNDPKQCRDDAG